MRSILSISLGFTLCFGANAQFIEHPLTWYPESNTEIISVDIEGDGDLDMIAASATSGPRFIENLGGNQFNRPVYLSEETGYTEHKAVDIDADGDIDLISLKSSAGIVSLFTNNGDNTFTESILYDTSPAEVSLLDIKDLSGDGNLDITFRLGETSLLRLNNDGFGSFIEQPFADDDTPEIQRYHHFDADGDLDADICLYDAAGKIRFYQNLGDSYAPPVIIATGVFAYYGLTSIDEDADGDLDILFSNSDRVDIIRNLGGGLFEAALPYFTYISTPLLQDPIDIDNDGQLDIALRNVFGGPFQYDWLRNLGGGSFAPIETLKNIPVSTLGHYNDIDGDGDMDLIDAAHYNISILYYENVGLGTFSEQKFLSETLLEPYQICKTDLDNDGDLDLVCGSVSDRKISWIENLGDGHFGHLNIIDYSSVLYPNSVSSTDVDGDGDQDILAVSFYEHKTLWYENLGGGNFGPQNILSTEHINPAYIAGADWDGDGDSDIMISCGGGGNKIVLFENVEGTFDPAGEVILSVDNPTKLIPDDMDGDGDLDVLFAANGEGTLNWLENIGDFTFSNHILATDYWWVEHATASDADEDGDLDVFFISESMMDNEIMLCENTGGGTFSSPEPVVSIDPAVNAILNVDVNNDGAKDLVVGSFDESNLVWYANMGGFEYSDPILISDNVLGFVCAIADDFDGDGDVDLVTTSFSDAKIAWFENIHTTDYSAHGKIFHDVNENGILDLGEEGINFTQALTTPASYYSYTNAMGDYTIVFDETELGDYTIFPQALEYWTITTAVSYDVTIDEDSALYENLDFGMYPSELVDRVDNRLTGGVARADDAINLWLDYSNTGSTIPSGTLHLVLADELTYISAEIAPETIDGQNIYWSYEDLGYFEEASLAVTVLVPGVASFGDTLKSYFIIEVDSLDEPVFTNMDSLEQVVQGPYDPNDKTVRPAGTGPLGYIAPETETLEYLIRFQNTGTDTAINVVIKDQLDPNLDWISLRPVAWSHDMEIEVDHEGEISFIFNDIMLPDSNVNELASHGFVKYEIDLLADLPLETSIYNTAYIYFDANPAIVTNTAVNTLHETGIDDSGIEENNELRITVYPNPFSDFTTVRFKKDGASKHSVIIYNLIGNVVYRQDNITGNSLQISKADLGSGLYILTLVNPDKNEMINQVKLVAE